MRVLVGITNFGTRSMGYLQRLLAEYRGMPFDVDVVVFSDIPKDLGPRVEVVVGLPTPDPWSLGFAHRRVFVERRGAYDLFIYSEDDTLITERNIRAFLATGPLLPPGQIAGFLRYEVDAAGKGYCSTVHSHFHWEADSVQVIDRHTFARFTNDHSAAYLLTREQLQQAIASGGYDVPPHQGWYDLLCTASTDPYTQCGFRKVICISRLEDFLLHHLPDKYLGRIGLPMEELHLQLDALLAMSRSGSRRTAGAPRAAGSGGGRTGGHRGQLFPTDKRLATARWNKRYYEPRRDELIGRVPDSARRILSVGCGWGQTEAELVRRGRRVTAIPLDEVIAACAQARGIEVVEADFETAFRTLAGRKFDCLLLSEVLQHLEHPPAILERLARLLAPGGAVVGSVPNFSALRARRELRAALRGRRAVFQDAGLHPTTARMLARWLRAGGFARLRLEYRYIRPERMGAAGPRLLARWAAARLLFSAEAGG
jgi:2-polyprenyl-3-methyl-5-hydroxy-6-metoxy-1,4-benzoquinol methylase